MSKRFRTPHNGSPRIDEDNDPSPLDDRDVIDGYAAGRMLSGCHDATRREQTAQAIVEAVATRGVRRSRPQMATALADGAC